MKSATAGVAARLKVKVVPGSSRDEIAGWLEDTLKLRVSAPPERGKANAAVVKLICLALRIPARQVRIVSGTGSARKVVEIVGLTVSELQQRLQGRITARVDDS